MACAENQGLRYLCDVDLFRLFPETLSEPMAAVLERFEDRLQWEQYLDFLINRGFRKTRLGRLLGRMDEWWKIREVRQEGKSGHACDHWCPSDPCQGEGELPQALLPCRRF
jgi:hypothetical protein